MKSSMKIQLICDGELINKHSDGGTHYGWHNPIDPSLLPPVGSIIEYLTFNQQHKEGQGVLTKYRVKNYTFTTEEAFNHTYQNKICKVEVERI